MISRPRAYPVTAAFERVLSIAVATRPNFYARAGHAVDHEALVDKANQLIVQAAHQAARDIGRGPDDVVIVAQRVRRWMSEGKVPPDELAAVEDALMESIPDDASILSEIVPILKKRMKRQAADLAIEDLNGAGDGAKTEEMLRKARRIGEVDETSGGTEMGAQSVEQIRGLHNLVRLPIGVPELDAFLEQGLWCGALGVAIGDPGAGKSMFLTGVAASSLRYGRNVALATLELPEPLQHARLMASITGVPIAGILDSRLDEAALEMDRVLEDVKMLTGHKPHAYIREFAAYATGAAEILSWVEATEQSSGEKIDLVVVDYGDKVGARARTKASSSYEVGLEVFEGFRKDASDNKRWHWTASQARRRDKKSKAKTDMDDVADSMHKVRVADLVITLNLEEDDQGNRQVTYFVAKNRVGNSRGSIGPYPVDYATGRMGG